MSEKRFTIKPQDDYWAVVDNYNDDKVCIINGIHTEIEAIWLCDFMNEQQAEIDDLKEENGKLRNIHLSIDLTYSYGYGRYLADVRVIDDE